MPLEPTQMLTDIPEIIGFRDDVFGNLPSTWSIVQGSNPDAQIKADVVNILWNPTTGTGTAATAVYNARAPQTIRYRAVASMRFVSFPLGFAGAVGLWDVGVLTTFSFGFRKFSIAPNTAAPTALLLGWPLNNTLQTKSMPFTVTPNLWYRMAIEVMDTTVRFYVNPTGNANITNVSNEASLNLLYTTQCDRPNKGLLFGLNLSAKAVAGNDYTGAGDVSFTGMRDPQPVNFGAAFEGGVSNPTGYTKYKSIREAQKIYNNVVVGA